jgi:transposase
MDTSEQAILDKTPKREARRRRSVEEKRRIVEETLEAGASVARVVRRHAVNANQVFYWRKKYREGRLDPGAQLPPEKVVGEVDYQVAAPTEREHPPCTERRSLTKSANGRMATGAA